MWGTYTGQAEELLEADEATLLATQCLQIDTYIIDTTWSNNRVSLTNLSSFSYF